MNLYMTTTIEFPWFGGWDWELCFHLDFGQWVWFDAYKDSGETGDTILGKELKLDSYYWDAGFHILCFGISLEGIKV